MKLLIVSMFVGLTASTFGPSTAQATIYRCMDSPSPGYQTVGAFDSTHPLLTVTVTQPGTNGKPVEESATIFSPNNACQFGVIFSTSCKATERTSNRGYDFSFSCNGGTSGEFYVDENGTANITCNMSTGSTARSVLLGCVKQ